ncbi:MAG: hypothetical protein H6713_06665 [Myxococcales bacterium]|nr:hypothetical protein [Myxococcales bacterium]
MWDPANEEGEYSRRWRSILDVPFLRAVVYLWLVVGLLATLLMQTHRTGEPITLEHRLGGLVVWAVLAALLVRFDRRRQQLARARASEGDADEGGP